MLAGNALSLRGRSKLRNKADMNRNFLRRLRRFALITLLFLLLPGLYAQAGLTPAQERGKAIYEKGRSSSTDQELTAYFGPQRIPLPAQNLPCSGCHGHDGTGRPESGLTPANITWPQLTKTYGHLHQNGLEHPPFDVQGLKDYLRNGLFPGGQPGSSDMPLYDLPQADLDDLVAYLRVLGDVNEVGVEQNRIRIGTLLPAEEPLSEVGRAIEEVIRAYFARVNAQGGLYGRSLELVPFHQTTPSPPKAEELSKWLGDENLFALLSPFLPAAEEALAEVVTRQEIPLLGPVTLFPLTSYARSRQTFYLFPGLDDQLRLLLRHTARSADLKAPRIALVHQDQDRFKPLLSALEQSILKHGWPAPLQSGYSTPSAADLAKKLQQNHIDLVVILGDAAQTGSFLQEAALNNWTPWVLASGQLAGRTILDAPPAFAGRYLLSYPTLPEDRQPWALQEMAALWPGRQLSKAHLHATISAYLSVRILVEGLRQAGKKLDRKGLITALEGTRKFQTGLTTPISFSENIHVGVRGTYVVPFSPTTGNRNPFSEKSWEALE